MSKNLKRIVALVLVLAVVISAFAVVTAQGFSATITGWPTKIDSSYTWFANDNITDAQKNATRNAMVDELKYQNEVLGFRIGTMDANGGATGPTANEWAMSTDWGEMVVVQIENRQNNVSDNTGNPWGDSSRVWGAVVAPFVNMAFTIKGKMAENYSAMGQNPTLDNEFVDSTGKTVQVFWKNYIIFDGTSYSTVSRFPGSKGGNDATGNMFRYAVAKYNQDNKRVKRGSDIISYHAGYPVADVATTSDNSITYQTLMGERGTSLIATTTQKIKEGKLEGAYVIPDTIATQLLALADNISDCFAITGAPIANADGGKQRFENGVISSRGFQKSSCEITSFDLGGGIASDIDDEAGTITAYVNSSANIANVAPTIVHNGASITPEGAQNFSSPVQYTVKAECGDTRTYTVTVIKLSDTDISSFTVAGVEASIDRETNTITALVDSGVNLASIAPVITTVGTGTTVSPASGANVDLSKSWDNGVKYTVTKGGSSTVYTVKVRNLSTDTSIVKFNIPEGSLKYQSIYGEVVGKISGTNIDLMYEYLNNASSSVVADVELAPGATISPDPTDARSQSNAKYTVTAEDGKTTAVYTVRVTIDPEKKIGPKEIVLDTQDMGPFGSRHNQELAKAAIQAEYNNQRVNLGYDPGEVSEYLSAWDNVLPIRQFFDGGSSSETMFGHTAAIMMDVPDGRAYTLKGRMLSLWQSGATTEDGENISWLFRRAGGAAVNEFQMNGSTYQQFSTSYGKYGNGDGMTMNGIGVAYSRQIEALKDSYYYYQPDNSLAGTNKNLGTSIDYAFRKAYEYANVLDNNPGIALDGNFNVIKLEGNTNKVVKDVEILGTKGDRTTETTIKEWPNYVMYQVFSGSGPTDATTRDASNKTVIIKGGNIDGVDHGGALALFGDIKKMYEAIPGDKQHLEFRDGNGGTGNVVDSVEYNVTLGTPSYYGVSKDNEYIMEFARDTLSKDEEGYDVMETEYFYYTAPVDDPTNITKHEGTRLSGNNRIASATMDISGAEIDILYKNELVFPDQYEEDDLTAPIYPATAIAINYPAGTKVDMEAIKFKSITLEDENAAIISPKVEEGSSDIPAIDCSASGSLEVRAENTYSRSYMIWVYIGGVAETFGAPEWKSWEKERELPPESYEWNEGYIATMSDAEKTQIWGSDPNKYLGLKDDNGQPLWIYEWGYYTDADRNENSWVKLDVPNDWDPNDPVNGWRVYREQHNLGVRVS